MIDEFAVYRRLLSLTDISNLYNSGNGCNPYGIVADTTPPVITFTSQTPTNLTALNGMQIGLNINYTITDATGVNTSSVKMNMTINNSFNYIDGKRYSMNQFNKRYTKNSGTNYNWYFDDNAIYNGIYLVNHSITEILTANAYVLSQSNDWLKTTFRNVSKKKQYSLVEGMAENATSTLCNLQIYYCNSSYTTGNPISSKNCAIFFEGINNNVINHTHGKLKDKLYPLAITNEKINGIGVTETSYILYRGNNVCNQNIYYTNQTHRVGDVQISNNNGVVYTNSLISPLLHLHQLGGNESINYQLSKICDTATPSNCVNSAKKYDIIDKVKLSPSSPLITSPTATSYQNTIPITISYTACQSPVNNNINRYWIQYAYSGSSSFTTIVTNNYPSLTYTWVISALGSGDYNIKVTCFDTLNQSAFSTSETFRIVSFTDLLLSDINQTLGSIYQQDADNYNNAKSLIGEGGNMLLWLILFVMFTLIGILTIQKWALILSGVTIFFLTMNQYYNTALNSSYSTIYKYLMLVFMIVGTLGLMAIGIISQLDIQTRIKKEKESSYRYEK